MIDSTCLQGKRRRRRSHHQPRPDGESPLRAEPDGHAAHRLGAHRALQLALRPPHRRHVRPARRRHRSRRAPTTAMRAPSSPTCAGSASIGTRGPTSAGRAARTGRASGSSRTAPRPTGCSPPGAPTTASAPRSASRSCARGARRRSHCRGTTAAVAASRPTRSGARLADGEPAAVRFAVPARRDRRRRPDPRADASSGRTRSATSSSCAPTAWPATTSPPSSTTATWASRT